MSLFSSLSTKLNDIFIKLSGHGRLTSDDIDKAMREVKLALLEADVNFLVVKNFISKISGKAKSTVILESLTPAQQVVKVVNEELTNLMGGTNSKLNFGSINPAVIMLCGLQGAGKTTLAGKLALTLKKQGKKPLLVACDIYRPAAITQLQVVAKSIDVEVFEQGKQNPVKIAKQAVEYATKLGYDAILLDTAGRMQINEELMQELVDIKNAVKPIEILLVVDSMTGQDAVNTAVAFNDKLDITGVVLTKLDGDTRGGAALSIKAVIGKPIKFCSVGEKLADLEPFYPDRMASRILGMGDVLTLIEKAQESIDEKTAKKMEESFRKNNFTLEDYLVQFENLKKMGSLTDIMAMIPGMGNKLKGVNPQVDEKIIQKNKAIILSMTKRERINPDILKGNQKKRIADGSGTTISEVNQLLKQFEQTKQLMKQFSSGKGLRFPF
ncbi:MAG: signal recognition particle protein [Clostridia bacterium]|jgi:signal recognition particle subunit SRP54|nr:signal recognition particle protein [Clostridia bacterium]